MTSHDDITYEIRGSKALKVENILQQVDSFRQQDETVALAEDRDCKDEENEVECLQRRRTIRIPRMKDKKKLVHCYKCGGLGHMAKQYP